MAVRLAIVSDLRFLREALAADLGARPRLDVIHALGPMEAVEGIKRDPPHVALLHLGIPCGPELARAVAAVAPRSATLALGVPEDAASVIAWAEAGVAGYAPPGTSLDELANSVQLVAAGWAACTPTAAAILLQRVARGSSGPTAPHDLTLREVQIAELLAANLSNKEIARTLSISLPTVKNHVHSILKKLQVDRRSRVGQSLHTF